MPRLQVASYVALCAISVLIVAAEQSLSNTDVLNMVNAGFSEAVIIQKIVSTSTAFDLSVNSLISLKKIGVSDSIIHAMLSKQSLGAVASPNDKRQQEFARLRAYLGLPENYAIAPALTAKLSKYPLRIYLNAGTEIHVIDKVKELATTWNQSWSEFGRTIEFVDSWPMADLVVSHYAAMEDIKQVSETRSSLRTDTRLVSGAQSDYGAMYAGIALRDPWLTLAGALPKPTQTLVPELTGETITERFDVVPVIAYMLLRDSPTSFRLVAKHVYTARNGKGLGQPLWGLMKDLLAVPDGLFVNSRNQVVAQDVSGIAVLEKLSGHQYIPFLIYSGQPQVDLGKLSLTYGPKGLSIRSSTGKAIFEGFANEKEVKQLGDPEEKTQLVVLFYQRAYSKASRSSVGGYIRVPR